MSSKIKVLPDLVINQIAAGEVIENPASVVKELIDNALDAGATKVTLEVRLGGRELIRVVDNGEGMSEDDALLSLERHATSKIRNFEDVENLHTMGFRGEALPSICSVSKMQIVTNASRDESKGTLIVAEGGRIFKATQAPREQGTTLEVKNLFYNVPVRKKYQRSPAYDFAEICKTVVNAALANPSVAFQLIHNQKTELLLHKEGKSFREAFEARARKCFGGEFFTHLFYFEEKRDGLILKGFLGQPFYNRPNRKDQRLFLNKRAVECPLISRAVLEGYGSSLPENRFPVFLLHAGISGESVDVNVHPQKKEVRLRRENLFFEAIQQAVSQAVTKKHLETPFVSHKQEEPAQIKAFSPQNIPVSKVVLHSAEKRITPTREIRAEIPTFDKKPAPLNEDSLGEPAPKILYCFSGYFLTEPVSMDQTGFAIFEQKALLRRLLHEQTSSAGLQKQIFISQKLLLPLPVSFSSCEVGRLAESQALFKEAGIELLKTGEETIEIHSLPQVLTEGGVQRVLEKFLESQEFRKESDSLYKLKQLLYDLICSNASYGGKTLSLAEAGLLVSKWMQLGKPAACPKGGAIVKPLPIEEITTLFERK